ncbi:hypothetical protein COO91_02248 [Nostoc flagelliforme CCNUN1]|uniref:Uncharacterized protein n=1 Tax=Nostoc flagelliforme CCNUN1 TaxID=2038116 RepID=A0A2K8SLH6_9NOSO|nr:hypothetical protein COO91_02248 [Nostoc flagelliforme CCNUN1]
MRFQFDFPISLSRNFTDYQRDSAIFALMFNRLLSNYNKEIL